MKRLLCFSVIIVMLISCKKQTESLNLVSINDLYPIAVGKTFIYRMDSTVSINFGEKLVKHSYLAKDSIESNFIDASGRNSFRIFRYTTDTLASQPWIYAATYYSTMTTDKVEYNDNNLRFITLVNPVSYNTTWKGNSYINTILPSTYYFMDNWDYHYINLDKPFICKKGTLQNTYTVMQQDSQIPQSGFDASQYNEKSYSIEVYAKGVGLIYKDFLHYIWQPTPSPKYEDGSWGIRLNLIDYK